jgi:hypothetical protein
MPSANSPIGAPRGAVHRLNLAVSPSAACSPPCSAKVPHAAAMLAACPSAISVRFCAVALPRHRLENSARSHGCAITAWRLHVMLVAFDASPQRCQTQAKREAPCLHSMQLNHAHRLLPSLASLTGRCTRTPTLAIAARRPVLVPSSLRLPAPVNFGVRRMLNSPVCTGQASRLLGGYLQQGLRFLVCARCRGMLAFKRAISSAINNTGVSCACCRPRIHQRLTVRSRGRSYVASLRPRLMGAPELGS